MTNWLPDLSKHDGPLYIRLARQIEDDISSGTLRPGTKLPPQRNLAFDIGVTVGTVSRAYAMVRERGLVTGEVGRGTYIAGSTEPIGEHAPVTNGWMPEASPAPGPGEKGSPDTIRFDTSAATPEFAHLKIGEAIATTIAESGVMVTDYVRGMPQDWQRAGARWIEAGAAWRPEERSIVPVHGTHSGIMAIISAMTNPGDRIACETLTYGTLPRSAQMIGRRVVAVAMDDKGIIPQSLETVCAQQHPKLLFIMPALHNPTTVTLPDDRRREIVSIARRYNVLIIEDNLYGSISRDPHAPIASYAPDITFHFGGMSKSVSAGLRTAWVACPPSLTARVLTAHKLLTGGKSFILADASARLVNSGAAHDIRNDWLAEIRARNAIVRQILGPYAPETNPDSPFIWLTLPDPWLSGTFKAAALEQSVRIDDEDEFKVDRGSARVHGVRVAFSIPAKRESVQRGAQILRELLDSGPSVYHAYN